MSYYQLLSQAFDLVFHKNNHQITCLPYLHINKPQTKRHVKSLDALHPGVGFKRCRNSTLVVCLSTLLRITLHHHVSHAAKTCLLHRSAASLYPCFTFVSLTWRVCYPTRHVRFLYYIIHFTQHNSLFS